MARKGFVERFKELRARRAAEAEERAKIKAEYAKKREEARGEARETAKEERLEELRRKEERKVERSRIPLSTRFKAGAATAAEKGVFAAQVVGKGAVIAGEKFGKGLKNVGGEVQSGDGPARVPKAPQFRSVQENVFGGLGRQKEDIIFGSGGRRLGGSGSDLIFGSGGGGKSADDLIFGRKPAPPRQRKKKRGHGGKTVMIRL